MFGDYDQNGRAEKLAMRHPKGFRAWIDCYAMIRNKAGKLVRLIPNRFQERVIAVVERCLELGIPIRILVLKPRQKGSSTISMAIAYWMMRARASNVLLMGGQFSQVANLHTIGKTYCSTDTFAWGFHAEALEKSIRMDNGGYLDRETARDSDAGRSGTYQGGIFTEAARWQEGGVAKATEVLTGVLACIPYLPDTFAILESTARGPSGIFYDYWQSGIDAEDFLSGRANPDDGYIRIFSPWFEHDDSRDKLPDRAAEETLMDSLDEEEREMALRFGLDAEQMAWWRRTLRVECKRDRIIMGREYPPDPETAFAASSRNRFNNAGLKVLRAGAEVSDSTVKRLGILESIERGTDNPRIFTFQPTPPPEARIILFEPPLEGRRYILGVDTMTGISETDNPDQADYHCATVLRDGYNDQNGTWHPPNVVARTVPCRWEIDVLSDWVWALSWFYGGQTSALTVIETNKDRGLILLLKERGLNLYQRTTDDGHGDVSRPKLTGKFGFNTTGGYKENTRNWIIEQLAAAIRDFDELQGGLRMHDLITMKELEHFEVDHKTGKAAAATGHHDDSVMALAMAFNFRHQGTIYRSPVKVPLWDRPPRKSRRSMQYS